MSYLENKKVFVQSWCGFYKNISVQKPHLFASALTDSWLGVKSVHEIHWLCLVDLLIYLSGKFNLIIGAAGVFIYTIFAFRNTLLYHKNISTLNYFPLASGFM